MKNRMEMEEAEQLQTKEHKVDVEEAENGRKINDGT